MSYGHTWIAERDTVVALLPIGYADGVFRSPEWAHRCADQRPPSPQRRPHLHGPIVVDLGPGPHDVAEGDEAILFGSGAAGEPTAQDWADLLGTIHYEVVTSPRGRVLRAYRGGDANGR